MGRKGREIGGVGEGEAARERAQGMAAGLGTWSLALGEAAPQSGACNWPMAYGL